MTVRPLITVPPAELPRARRRQRAAPEGSRIVALGGSRAIGDGCGYVVVGGPATDGRPGGQVKVTYGPAAGPSTTRVTWFHQDTPGADEYDDRFGNSAAIGGYFESVGAFVQAGYVAVLEASATGLTGAAAFCGTGWGAATG